MPDLQPIRKLKTHAAQLEAANYRRLGVRDSDMMFFLDDVGEEVITVNKRGVVALARNSPLKPLERVSRIGFIFRTVGVPFELNDELEILAGR